MYDLNLSLDFGNLAKLINKGRVDKVYNKMYAVANDLAVIELKQYILKLRAAPAKTGLELVTMITDFKQERMK